MLVIGGAIITRCGEWSSYHKRLIETGKLEAVITLVGGVFYGAGVSACILYLNNNKPASRRDKVCMIDASAIYTAKRAQNIMTEDDIDKVWKLWEDYSNVIDLCTVVSLDAIREKGYTLTVSSYIEKTAAATVDPAQVRREFNEALQEVRDAEAELTRLLKEGGYIDG